MLAAVRPETRREAFYAPGHGGQELTRAAVEGGIRSETDFVFVLYRTQLKNSADIEAVKAVQAGYKVQTLSQFLGEPPKTVPDIVFP